MIFYSSKKERKGFNIEARKVKSTNKREKVQLPINLSIFYYYNEWTGVVERMRVVASVGGGDIKLIHV